MKLFIPDLYEILKHRIKELTNPKASDDPTDVMIRLKDVTSITDEIKKVAEQQATEIARLKEEDDDNTKASN